MVALIGARVRPGGVLRLFRLPRRRALCGFRIAVALLGRRAPRLCRPGSRRAALLQFPLAFGGALLALLVVQGDLLAPQVAERLAPACLRRSQAVVDGELAPADLLLRLVLRIDAAALGGDACAFRGERRAFLAGGEQRRGDSKGQQQDTLHVRRVSTVR